MGEWAVVEFDAEDSPVWSAGPYDEAQARARFAYVTRKRSQRADVVQRARSAALLCRGKVVEAAPIRRSQRKPALGDKRLLSLDVDSRERIIGLELLAHRMALAGLRRDGRPRVGPGWSVVRSVVCELWELVRGAEAARVALAVGEVGRSWWLVEWACGCCQVERVEVALGDCCPYHDAPRRHGPDEIDPGS